MFSFQQDFSCQCIYFSNSIDFISKKFDSKTFFIT